MSEEHILDYLPAYALECLDEEDELRVAEHLATCQTCRLELQSYQGLVEELPLAIAEREPPPGLKEKILQRARESKGHAAAMPGPSRQSWLARLRALSTWPAFSLVLILVLGASNLLLWGRLNTLESQSRTQLMTILLQGTPSTPDATGLVVVSLDGTHGTLVVDQLPVLGETQQYQLWLIRDGKRTSGGIFSVDDKGYKSLYVKSPQPLVSFSSFGITIEPAGGSPAPTGDKVLGGDL